MNNHEAKPETINHHIETSRKYGVAIRVDLEEVDQMHRNTFVAYATSQAEKAKQSLKSLLIDEWDTRRAHAAANTQPPPGDTVEP